MTRYHVLCADALMDDSPRWPAGLRPVKRGRAEYGVPPYTPGAPQSSVPWQHWWEFEDDGAPPELEGKRVCLTVSQEWVDDAWSVHILAREVVGD